jgi:hypothetical protein
MKVYVVKKNCDFTEGRGPMMFDGIFSSLKKAKEYLNMKGSGIMGAKAPEGISFADWCMSKNDGGWAGYTIEEHILDENLRR